MDTIGESLLTWGQQSARASSEDKTGQKTDEGYCYTQEPCSHVHGIILH